jgi:hypothetical protein
MLQRSNSVNCDVRLCTGQSEGPYIFCALCISLRVLIGEQEREEKHLRAIILNAQKKKSKMDLNISKAEGYEPVRWKTNHV